MNQPSGDLAFSLLAGNAKFQKAFSSVNKQRENLGAPSLNEKEFYDQCSTLGTLRKLANTPGDTSGKSKSSPTKYSPNGTGSERTWGGKYGEDDYS